MMKYSILFASLMTIGLSACNQEQTEAVVEQTAAKVTHTVSGYTKPNASIAFAYTLPERIEAGDSFTVELSFSPTQTEGSLEVAITAPELDIISGTGAKQYTLGQSSYQVPVTLHSAQDGTYYLNVFTELTTSAGLTRGQVNSIELKIGDQFANKAEKPSIDQDSKGNSIKVLNAVEEIIIEQ